MVRILHSDRGENLHCNKAQRFTIPDSTAMHFCVSVVLWYILHLFPSPPSFLAGSKFFPKLYDMLPDAMEVKVIKEI
jgi:hypothetical protein